jgi:serine-type D-Ala-D-Ala endopeptidase (penicillin-binding protein 7)
MVKFGSAKAAWWCVVMVLVCAMPFSTALAKEQAASAKRKAVTSTKSSKVVIRGASVRRASMRAVRFHSVRPSFGHMHGLRAGDDPLDLKSSVALVMDQETNEILIDKNTQAVLPIASITKLMTALVVAEAQQPLDEMLTITQDDVDTEKGSHSRLRVGTQLNRGEMLHLALMASENRAANALGRNFPGGLDAFVAAMNTKARALGMLDTHYVEPTGLSSRNQASARDLATLVNAAYQHQLIRDLSVSPEHQVAVGRRQLQFRNTNLLVRDAAWDIGLQKTGYITEAGRCLVMQASLAGRKVIMVFLDSAGKYSRIGDAERVRRWITEHTPVVAPRSSQVRTETEPVVVPAQTEVPLKPVAVTS